MNHNVAHVARSQRLDVEKFVEFAQTHHGAYIDEFSKQLITSTLFVDDLIDDFLAAGNTRLPWVSHPDGGMVQPGFLPESKEVAHV